MSQLHTWQAPVATGSFGHYPDTGGKRFKNLGIGKTLLGPPPEVEDL